jgi:hypothetical protein
LKTLLLRESERVDRATMDDVRELALDRAQRRGMTVDLDLRHNDLRNALPARLTTALL